VSALKNTDINETIRSLNLEVAELQTRLALEEHRTRSEHRGSMRSIAKRILLSAERLEELVSKEYP